MEFEEIVEGMLDVIEHEGALRVAGDLNALPGGEIAIDFALHLRELVLDALHLARHVDVAVGGAVAELGELALEIDDGLFEFERFDGGHGGHFSAFLSAVYFTRSTFEPTRRMVKSSSRSSLASMTP